MPLQNNAFAFRARLVSFATTRREREKERGREEQAIVAQVFENSFTIRHGK
jgi:hypothetical protein